jgi:hypothetical protein
MSIEKDPWFVVQRSESLASLLLTSRDDVRVHFQKEGDDGRDIWAEITDGGKPTGRVFIVQVKGTMQSDENKWLPTVKHFFTAGGSHTYLPTVVFVVNVRDNKAYFAWVSMPAEDSGQARLMIMPSPTFHELNNDAINHIVDQVKAWYSLLPKALIPKTA